MDVIVGGPFHHPGFFWDHNADATVLKRVTVDEALGDHRGQAHDILDLLGSDILTLRQLEDILRPVNDFERAIRVDLDNIACAEPAIFVKRLACLGGILVIAVIDRGALEQKFSARVGLVLSHIFHLGETLDSHLHDLYGAANVPSYHVLRPHEGTGGRGLGESVALLDRAREADLEEVNDLFINGRRTREHRSYVASEHLSSLTEKEHIIATMTHGSICFQVCLLGRETTI